MLQPLERYGLNNQSNSGISYLKAWASRKYNIKIYTTWDILGNPELDNKMLRDNDSFYIIYRQLKKSKAGERHAVNAKHIIDSGVEMLQSLPLKDQKPVYEQLIKVIANIIKEDNLPKFRREERTRTVLIEEIN